MAVVDLSLGIHRAECFGFLGVNGAGKTTTLSILTGDYLPTHGGAWIGGHHVVHDRQRVRERMGYCPQVSASPPPTDLTQSPPTTISSHLRPTISLHLPCSPMRSLTERVAPARRPTHSSSS